MRIRLLVIFGFLLIYSLYVHSQEVNFNNFYKTSENVQQLIQDEKYQKAKSLINQMKQTEVDTAGPNYSSLIKILNADLNRTEGNIEEANKTLQKVNLKELQNKTIKSEYYYLKSKLANDAPKAIDYIRKGIQLKKDTPPNLKLTDLSHFYNSLGIYYQRMYKLDSAKYYYQSAINTAKKIEKKPGIHKDIALFHQNLALPYAMGMDYELAKKYLFKSVKILNSLKQKYSEDLSRNYLNIGRLFLLTGNIDSASYYYTKTLKLRQNYSKENSTKLANVYNNLGQLQTVTDNMAKARIYFQKAKKLYKNTGSQNNQKLHQSNHNLGFTYQIQREYTKAISYFKEAIKSPDKITVGKAFRNLADCYNQLNKPDSAILYFNKALDQFREAGDRGRYDLALNYLYYGNFLIAQGNSGAIDHLNKGKDILVSIFGEFHRDASRANGYIAKYHLEQKEYDKALSYTQEAITSSISDFNNSNPSVNPDIEKFGNKSHLITAVSLKGKIFFQRGKEKNSLDDLEKAFKNFETATEIINRIRVNYTYESNKLMITERSQEEYNWILKVLKELFDQTGDEKYLAELFQYMEKSKSAVLLSSITDSKAKITANLPDSIIEKEKWLRTRISGFKNLVYEERQKKISKRNEEKIDEWENIIFTHQQHYDSLKTYIKNKYNQYYKLRMKPSVIDLKQAVSEIDEDEVIVEYSILENQLMIFTISKDNQAIYIADITQKKLNDLINTFRNNLRVKAFVNFDRNSYHEFTQAGYELFETLIAPIYNKTSGKDLVFIPDGKLGYIPFELLLTSSQEGALSNKMDYKNLPYLLRKRPVSYAYSATLLFSDIKEKSPAEKKVLAMAPSYDNISNKPVDSIFTHRQGGEILLPIPGVGEEVKNISKTYRSKVLKDTLATEQTFKQVAPDYSVLHLAMHALVDDRDPMYSKLVFYQDPQKKNQGLLNTYELFDLSLGAEMAVLSACNTGYGKLQRGEGIMSLARGFLYAGVPNIVMTLWPIEDESTSEIMNYFYQHLSQGAEKDEALRKAKLQFLKNTDMLNAHPHFWGSFVSIGPDTPLRNVKEQSTTPYWIGGGLVLAVIIGLIVRRRIK